mgnify:CR=1 FL=1
MDNNKSIISDNNELCIIDETIHHLISEIDRYGQETKELWDNHILNFIHSGDCVTLDKIGSCGYSKFYDLMTNQKTFKLMKISLKRLNRRKKFLLKNR